MTSQLDESVNLQLNELLEELTKRLDLTDSQRKEAISHYRAVGEYLSDSDSPVSDYFPEIRPQGSMLQGTVVRPQRKDEYDLDLVCILKISSDDPITASKAYELLHDRLRNDGIYSKMLTRESRCLRLTYAHNFHLDILPAKSILDDPMFGIMIPSRDRTYWQRSNPFRFAGWLKTRCIMRKPVLLEARKIVDPPSEGANTPLQRVIQLMKRRRDIMFENDQDTAPKSIVLTTLAGERYEGHELCFEALIDVLRKIDDDIKATQGIMVVKNPVDVNEILSRDWTETSYGQFKRYISTFLAKLKSLEHAKGLEEIKAILGDLFGEYYAAQSVEAYARKLQGKREAGILKFTRGPVILGAAVGNSSRPVRGNTFFGR